MRMDSDMPGMPPASPASQRPLLMNLKDEAQSGQLLQMAMDAAIQRLLAEKQLVEKTAALMEADRHDDDAASEILIAAGAVANAMRIERDAVAQMRQSSA